MKNISLVPWRDPALCFLLMAGSLTVMAGAVMAPILPELMVQRQIPPSWAGSLVSAHYLTLAIFSPIAGVLADRHGRLTLLIPSLVGYAVAGMSGALLPTYPALLLGRGLLGVASGGVAAASLGLLSQRYSGEARNQAIAHVATAITLANIVYPLLAVGMGQASWQLAFGLYGLGLGLAGLAPRLFWEERRGSPAPSTKSAETTATPSVGALLKSPASLRIFGSLTLIAAVVYGTIIYLPLYLKTQLDSGLLWNGLILAVQAIGAALSSSLLLPPLTRRLGSLQVTALGLACMTIFLGSFPHLTHLGLLMAASGLFGLSFGVVTPSLYTVLANLAPVTLQSSILATGIGAGFLGQFLSPLVLGYILSLAGLQGVFYSCAGLMLLLSLSLLIPLKPRTVSTHTLTR